MERALTTHLRRDKLPALVDGIQPICGGGDWGCARPVLHCREEWGNEPVNASAELIKTQYVVRQLTGHAQKPAQGSRRWRWLQRIRVSIHARASGRGP